MCKVIVFGASGQLGQCLQLVSAEKELTDIHFLPEEETNILDLETLQEAFKKHKPEYVINCAAYTAVDKAEDEPEVARKVNVDGVANLSRLCKEYNSTLIHISTDFVFSGKGYQPLSEEDEVSPISVYGSTKLEGEKIIPDYLSNYFILRTSWLYSEFGNNFVKTILRLGKEREELRVIWDQVGTPTYAVDLAGCIIDLIKSGSKQHGTYHYSNEGLASWYDFTKAIFRIANLSTTVIPVRTSEYVTKAERPAFSVMDKSKIKQTLGISIPHWEESLIKCLNSL
jgi:dTDP-4-dehydrorhamnose reductase